MPDPHPDPHIDTIIDAHHHLWDLGHCHYPWLMEKGIMRFFGDPSAIQKNYLVDDFKRDIGGLPVRGSVHIQVGTAPEDSLKETTWLAAQNEAHNLPSAIIAFCDLTASDMAAQLEAHAASASRGVLRGVRQIISRAPLEDSLTQSPQLLDNSDFKAGLKRLATYGLSFDLQLTPPFLHKMAGLLSACADVKIALCHMGSPSDFSRTALAEWQSGLTALAQHPNVICKISGMGMFAPDWDVPHLYELSARAIDVFSPSRIAFGSNFPVDSLCASYARIWDAYDDVTKAYEADERRAMFYQTAKDFYHIVD